MARHTHIRVRKASLAELAPSPKARPLSPRELARLDREAELGKALNEAATLPASEAMVIEATGDEKLLTIRPSLKRILDAEPRNLNWGVRGSASSSAKGLCRDGDGSSLGARLADALIQADVISSCRRPTAHRRNLMAREFIILRSDVREITSALESRGITVVEAAAGDAQILSFSRSGASIHLRVSAPAEWGLEQARLANYAIVVPVQSPFARIRHRDANRTLRIDVAEVCGRLSIDEAELVARLSE